MKKKRIILQSKRCSWKKPCTLFFLFCLLMIAHFRPTGQWTLCLTTNQKAKKLPKDFICWVNNIVKEAIVKARGFFLRKCLNRHRNSETVRILLTVRQIWEDTNQWCPMWTVCTLIYCFSLWIEVSTEFVICEAPASMPYLRVWTFCVHFIFKLWFQNHWYFENAFGSGPLVESQEYCHKEQTLLLTRYVTLWLRQNCGGCSSEKFYKSHPTRFVCLLAFYWLSQ